MRWWENGGASAQWVKPYNCRLCRKRTGQSLKGMVEDRICPWCAQSLGKRICEGLNEKPGVGFFEDWSDWEAYKLACNKGRAPILKATREKILARDNYRCQICGSDDRPRIDHKRPVALGGGSEEDNLWVLCHPCNSKKGAKPLDEFLAGLVHVGDGAFDHSLPSRPECWTALPKPPKQDGSVS